MIFGKSRDLEISRDEAKFMPESRDLEEGQKR